MVQVLEVEQLAILLLQFGQVKPFLLVSTLIFSFDNILELNKFCQLLPSLNQNINLYHLFIMAEEFLQSICGKTLLDLVARGSAILAEMQRLSQHVPKIFVNPGAKYKQIIHDYSYFSNYNKIQDKIQQNYDLNQLNENIRKNYLQLLQKFYRLFDSIITYHQSLTSFVEQIQRGVFIQFSLQNMFLIVEGKQLICEAFYLFGVMLLLMDRLIQGKVRQRLIVCYYRNKGGENINRINEIRRLCSDRGFRVEQESNPEATRPTNYPQQLFQMFPLDQQVVQSIIIAIKDDDIYKQMPAYPQAKYRSFALANQAAMIWVILFMRADVLHKAKSTMRQIVDKHFYNAWVLPFYLGFIVDLSYWWKPYKAAWLALSNILDYQNIQELASQFALNQTQCSVKCKQFLTEGVMTEQFVLYKITALMNCLRQSNVCLRWFILHRATTDQKLRALIHSVSNPVDILRLLLICAQFQIVLKQKCQQLLDKKQSIWEQDQAMCVERMKQLSAYFGNENSLGKIQSDQSFKSWFAEIANVISSINFTNSTYASRKIQQVIESLKDIEQYHQISSSIQIKQYLYDTCHDLDHMVKLANVKKSHITSIDIISDITWSWITLKEYIKYIQKEIRKDPDISLLLKNTFMKLSSILNTPMLRIIQAQSPDIDPVSNFYSEQLIKIVKVVLQVIPRLVFHILGYIINIFTQKLKNEPLKFDKAQLANLAQFEDRLEIAKYNHEISVFAKSILNMESYLLGVIEVNPRQILEKGIRKQLIRLLAQILQQSLTQPATNPDAFLLKLSTLAIKLDSFKLSLQYVQDFVHIYGLKMYYEEFQKLIYCYVDMEKNSLIVQDVGFEELNYDEDIPIPNLKDPQCNTFLGWILRELIELTNPKKATFILTSYGFFNFQTGKQLVNLKTMNNLHKCIGISGLQGLDYLLSIRIMKELDKLVRVLKKTCEDENARKILDQSYQSLKNVSSFTDRYDHTIMNLKKFFKPLTTQMAKDFVKIGHYMLLRDMICLELRMLSKVGSPRLYLVLQNLNSSLLNEMIKNQSQIQHSKDQIDNQNLLLALVNPYFKHLGMLEPMKKVFITSEPIQNLPLIVFATLCSYISDFDYDNKLKSLIRSNKQAIEPNYFLTGLLCFFQQFHPSNKQTMFAYLASYIKSTVNFIVVNKEVQKNPELISDLFTYIRFFEQAIKYSRQPYEKYKAIIDLGLFSSLDKQTLKPVK